MPLESKTDKKLIFSCKTKYENGKIELESFLDSIDHLSYRIDIINGNLILETNCLISMSQLIYYFAHKAYKHKTDTHKVLRELLSCVTITQTG